MTATPLAAQTQAPSFTGNRDARARYLEDRLDNVPFSQKAVTNFVANVFNFNGLKATEYETAWKRAADASIALARTAPADFQALACLARATQGGLIYVLPTHAITDARILPVSGDYLGRLNMLARSTSARACRNRVI